MLKRDITCTFGGSVVSTVLALGTQIALARALGPAQRGILAMALLIPMVLSVFCGLGQDTVNATFSGLYPDQRRSLFLHSLLLAIAAGSASMVALCAFYFWLPIPRGEYDQVTPDLVWLSTLYVPCYIFSMSFSALLRGVGRIATAAVYGSIAAAALLVLTLVWVCRLHGGLTAALLTTSLTPLVLAIGCVWELRGIATLRPRYISVELLRRSLGFGLLTSLANFAILLTYRANQAILGYLGTAEEIGIFVVALGLAERLRVLPNAITTAFLPRLANEFAQRRDQVPRVYRYTLLITLLGALGAAVLGAPAIVVLFGREFIGAIMPFLLLLPGVVMLAGDSVLSSALLARGKPKYAMWTSWFTLAASIVLNLLLIPPLGIAGAALASTVAYCMCASVTLYLYMRVTETPLREMAPRWADVSYLSEQGKCMLLRTPGRGAPVASAPAAAVPESNR